MRNSRSTLKARHLLIISLALLTPFAQAFSTGAHPATSVNIVNNSSKAIRHVYLSHVNIDDWGPDQLTVGLSPGQSINLSVACDQQQVKVIGENEDGCFVTTVVNCDSSSTWTVTNNTTPDCGY